MHYSGDAGTDMHHRVPKYSEGNTFLPSCVRLLRNFKSANCHMFAVSVALKSEFAEIDESLKVEILGKKYKAKVISESPYDPENKLLKS